MSPRRCIKGSAGSEIPSSAPVASLAPAAQSTGPVLPPFSGGRTGELLRAVASARTYRKMLLALPGVIAVRAGYKFVGGRITRNPAVIVSVEKKADIALREAVPPVLPDGMATDVTPADPYERLTAAGQEVALLYRPHLLIEQLQAEEAEAALLEAVPAITYTPPPGADLEPVTGAMVITCHVSPDAGWPVLRPFLDGTRKEITLGMYDFTAPHIYQTIRSLLRDSDVRWRQTLGPNESLPKGDDVDSTKADDKPEASIIRGLKRVASDRFENAFALVGTGKTFASAYHIKVAVRDREAVWLSSGNWQSSNQPNIDFMGPASDRKLIPKYNREWHAVIENRELAEKFRRYLEHDYKTAAESLEIFPESAAVGLPDLLVPAQEMLEEERGAVGLDVFPAVRFIFGSQDPLTIQPILTPDNYLDIVLNLLRHRPKQRLYFQNQSLNPVNFPTREWAELLELLVEYSNDTSLDVRIIFRNIGPIRKKLESLQVAGFNMERVRVQSACHTKGIVIDSSTVLLGSHNWTNQGVQVNRDASLLIKNQDIARYYERVFLHDWERLARPTIREEAMPVPIEPGVEASAVAGGVDVMRLPWSAWEEE